jgi:hypothetical protein
MQGGILVLVSYADETSAEVVMDIPYMLELRHGTGLMRVLSATSLVRCLVRVWRYKTRYQADWHWRRPRRE